MTSIERTAYPRFSKKQQFNKQWLFENFYISEEDYLILKMKRNVSDQLKLAMAIQLKVFQYLGYFLDLNNIPGAVIKTIRDSLGFHSSIKANYINAKTKYRHRNNIRERLKVTKWKGIPHDQKFTTQRLAIKFAYDIAHTMNNPADILNATLEFMTSYNYELPAFSTIDRMIRHIRQAVNTKIYNTIYLNIKNTNVISEIDQLLRYTDKYNRTKFNNLKALPCSPTISNINKLINHYSWLHKLVDTRFILGRISNIKLSQFAEYTRSLDASDIREMNEVKKYALVVVLINNSQKEVQDGLATMFCKTVFKLHADSKRELERLQDIHSLTTQKIAETLEKVTIEITNYNGKKHKQAICKIVEHLNSYSGGLNQISDDCKKVAAYNSKNHLPLLWQYLKSKRASLFNLLNILNVKPATQDNNLITALEVIMNNRTKFSEYLTLLEPLNLSFTTKEFQKLIKHKDDENKVNRKYLEASVFTSIAIELKSGDLYVEEAKSYADYRNQLLPWDICITKLANFCNKVDIAKEPADFIIELKNKLTTACKNLDQLYPELENLYIDEDGYPRLKRIVKNNPKSTILLEEIRRRMKERSLLDIMCNSHQYTDWANVFGPLSGSEPKLKNATDKYIINSFSTGTGMGPTQTARHVRAENISTHVLSNINNRHVNVTNLNQANNKLINYANSFSIIHLLGDKNKSGFDGTLRNIFEDNLLAETHYRYKNKGAIAYHHVSDTYVALFSTFIPCGVWEAVEIIDSLMKNQSDIQPQVVHADTQGQSSTVFGLGYLLGIQIMPRIRNFKELRFYKSSKNETYSNIDSLFGDNVINWELLETHWQDLMQVVISIQEGTISSSLLLRKLNNNSRKNKIYKVFRELGNVIRTIYLLEYISDLQLRDSITETTNKVESFNELSQWCSFGSKYIVASNDPNEMEKALKQNTIVANCIIVQNLIDISSIICELKSEGWDISKDDVKKLSPYLTEHIKRFGDYIYEMTKIDQVPDEIRELKVA